MRGAGPLRRPGRVGRRVAAATVLAVVLVAGTATGRALAVRTNLIRPRPVPFALPRQVRSAVARGRATSVRPGVAAAADDAERVGSPQPSLILYASASCAHCHAELARWARVAAADEARWRRLAFTVVTPGPRDAGAFVPPGLAHARVYDDSGAIARALGVRGVPALYVVDARDSVRAVLLGEQADSTLARIVRTLPL